MPITIRATLQFAVAAIAMLSPSISQADEIQSYPVERVLNNPEYKGLFQDIKFYFGNQAHPEVISEHGPVKTNRRSNGTFKKDSKACDRAAASALKAIAGAAKKAGGNAIINIKSNFKNNLTTSDTDYTCGAGALMSGVALVGDIVTVK